MSNQFQDMTEGMQTKIRELAYLMWESAGRQQGMAMEYWLKAETEVLSTLQAAAARMISPVISARKEPAETTPSPVRDAEIAVAPTINAPKSPPVERVAPPDSQAASGKALAAGGAKSETKPIARKKAKA